MRRVREAAEASARASGVSPESQPDTTRQLFEQFVDARKSVGLPVEGITEESFRKTLDKQREIHTANPEINDVEFSIKVRDGRVVVVARPVR